MTTVYITKWWATKGIIERVFDESVEDDGRFRRADSGNVYYSCPRQNIFAKIGTDAFYTRGEAVAKVRKAAAKKVKTLTKQMLQMEAIASGAKDL